MLVSGYHTPGMDTPDPPEQLDPPGPPGMPEPPQSAEPAANVPIPLQPGQLSPGWRMVFIAGWVGVLGGFGAVWYAGRIAGIAPWWLGPETDPRSVFVIAAPFVAPLVAVVACVTGRRWACYFGIIAGLISASIALGDLHFPGLAVVDAIIGLCGISISVACLGGRMRPAPVEEPADVLAVS